MPVDPDNMQPKKKPPIKDYVWDGKCPFCGSDRKDELYHGNNDIFICLGCGAGFRKVNGRFIHDSVYDVSQIAMNRFHENSDEDQPGIVKPRQYTYEEEDNK